MGAKPGRTRSIDNSSSCKKAREEGEKKTPHANQAQVFQGKPQTQHLKPSTAMWERQNKQQNCLGQDGQAVLSSCVCLPATFLPHQPRPGFVFSGCAGKQLLHLTHARARRVCTGSHRGLVTPWRGLQTMPRPDLTMEELTSLLPWRGPARPLPWPDLTMEEPAGHAMAWSYHGGGLQGCCHGLIMPWRCPWGHCHGGDGTLWPGHTMEGACKAAAMEGAMGHVTAWL